MLAAVPDEPGFDPFFDFLDARERLFRPVGVEPRNSRDHEVETAFQDRDHAVEDVPPHPERMKHDDDVGIPFPELMDRDLVLLHRDF